MHIGKSYTLSDFIFWTRRSIYCLILLSAIPTALYQFLNWKWLVIPWQVAALVGTATAFIVGFKNSQTYNRTWEARQIWGATMSASRSWAMMCRDYIEDTGRAKAVIYRHFAWLTALRYQLRSSRIWEAQDKSYNMEYKQFYSVPEIEFPLEGELAKYIQESEVKAVVSKKNIAVQLLALQALAITELHREGLIEQFKYLQMHEALREFSSYQGRSERIKNFPYPRQYATINKLFVRLFCILLPFALLGEFKDPNYTMDGLLRENTVWLVIPFSVLISWVYTSLEQVGEGTENPFEGNANDVPISQLSRAVEIDIREMLGENDLPPALIPRNNIIL